MTDTDSPATHDRSLSARIWYRFVQWSVGLLFASFYGFRSTGNENIPESGGALLVCNHVSHLDVFVIGIPLNRPLNYVARSTLFFPPLGVLIRSVGGFPIQRDGMGASGVKETLRRVRAAGIVALFPEGTRSADGNLAELKSGIAVLAARAKVPVIPVAVAGTFEAWPRTQSFPKPHPLRVHYGAPIPPEQVAQLDAHALTHLIAERILDCQRIARASLARDLGDARKPPLATAAAQSLATPTG